jgi:malonyl CoA-acyl carrier protein transacylase
LSFVGKTSASIVDQLDQRAAYLNAHKDVSLANVAYTAWSLAQKSEGEHRLSITAKGFDDLRKKIAFARKKLTAGKGLFSTRTGVHYQDTPLEGKLAFMMPGEGSQYMHMLADLAQHFDPVREWLDFWYGLKRDADLEPLTDIVYPVESELSNEKRVSLNQTLHSMTVGSEAAFIAGQAMHALMKHLGVPADAMVGHSTGESGALLAAGVVQAKTNKDMVANFNKITEISKLMENDGFVPTGALLAVGLLDVEEIAKIADEFDAVIAMENCPNQIIVYSHIDRVQDLSAALGDQGAVCELLPFDRGYHTSEFEPMRDAFETFYSDLGMHLPKLDLYSCAAADVFPKSKDGILELAAKQWSHKVRFIDTIKKMYADGVRYFIEVGPGGKLTSFAEQILSTSENKNKLLIAASNQHNQTGMRVLLSLMGRLFVNNRVSLEQLFAERDVQVLDFADLSVPKPVGMFVDNSIPRVSPTPELVGFLQGLLPSAQIATTAAADYPFLAAIQHVSKTQLTAQVQMDVQTQRYLQDHVLSGPVGLEQDLYGLPCVPLMCSLEIMAEAAAALLGRNDLTTIENVLGERWIALEDDQSQLDVSAELTSDTNTVRVSLNYQGQRSVSGTFKFGAPVAQSVDLPAVIPTQDYCAPGAYETYREHIFHGPVFQSIEYVTAWSETGIEATLSDVDLSGFFTDDQVPNLIINPVLYDAFTQITAFWLAQEIGPHFASFPCSIDRIDIFGSVKDRCDDLTLRAQRGGELTEGQDGVWNIACYHADQPVVRIHNLKNAFSRLPQQYYHYSLEPINGWMGHPIEIDGGVQWTVPQLPNEFWHRLGGVFLKVLAFSNLSEAERAEWRALPQDLNKKAEWLLPRVAIKEAMRYWLHEATGEFIYATEIPVHMTETGALMPFGQWFETFEQPNLAVQSDGQTIFVTVTNNTTMESASDSSETAIH